MNNFRKRMARSRARGAMNRIGLVAIVLAGTVAAPVLAQRTGYPAVGESATELPAENSAITFRGSRYYFASGSWYQQVVAGYVVVKPPAGIVVPGLPPVHTTVWVGGAPYYAANEVFYQATPGGYQVVRAPIQATAPPPLSAPAASAGENWYYCDSAQAYYPYVSNCTEGWRAVAAIPPQLQ